MEKINPFVFVDSILQQKEPMEDISDYVPFLVNRSLSQHYDCIMQSNEMNIRHDIEKDMQYAFLFNSIRKYKRPFKKWSKKEKPDDLEIIKEYFGYSTIKAREILPLLSKENIEHIKKKMQKGGFTK